MLRDQMKSLLLSWLHVTHYYYIIKAFMWDITKSMKIHSTSFYDDSIPTAYYTSYTSTKYKFYNNNHTYRWFMFRISAWVFSISLQKLCVIKRQFSFVLLHYMNQKMFWNHFGRPAFYVHVLNFLGFTSGCNEVGTLR